MRAVYLAHSGFLLELDGAALLFDWWKGELPALGPEVPLLVFASHRHPDHFDPRIFALDDGTRPVRFLLGQGIRLTPRNLARWGVPASTAGRCLLLRGGEEAEPLPGVHVEALRSTDEGAAFFVAAGEGTVFHAGDLNWWHWAGEDPAWNRNMEADFKRYAEPLRGRRIDCAMLPLDPRLGEDGFLGPEYFLRLADIRRFLPMHQWGDYGFTDRFLSRFPAWAGITERITGEGQSFEIPPPAGTG